MHEIREARPILGLEGRAVTRDQMNGEDAAAGSVRTDNVNPVVEHDHLRGQPVRLRRFGSRTPPDGIDGRQHPVLLVGTPRPWRSRAGERGSDPRAVRRLRFARTGRAWPRRARGRPRPVGSDAHGTLRSSAPARRASLLRSAPPRAAGADAPGRSPRVRTAWSMVSAANRTTCSAGCAPVSVAERTRAPAPPVVSWCSA